jgi:hypothetical protein
MIISLHFWFAYEDFLHHACFVTATTKYYKFVDSPDTVTVIPIPAPSFTVRPLLWENHPFFQPLM